MNPSISQKPAVHRGINAAVVATMVFCLSFSQPSSAYECRGGRASIAIKHYLHFDRSQENGGNVPDLSTEFYSTQLRLIHVVGYRPLSMDYAVSQSNFPDLQLQIGENTVPVRMALISDEVGVGGPGTCRRFARFESNTPSETGVVLVRGMNPEAGPALCYVSSKEAVMQLDFEIRSSASKMAHPLTAKDIRVFMMLERLDGSGTGYPFDTARPCD